MVACQSKKDRGARTRPSTPSSRSSKTQRRPMRLLQPLIDGGGKGFQYPKPFTPLHKGRGEPPIGGEGVGL